MDEEFRGFKVSDLESRAECLLQELRAQGDVLHPVKSKSKNLAKSFWGKAWMKSLQYCEQQGMRLAGGRTYLRHGCVLDVQVEPGLIRSRVLGEFLYDVEIRTKTLDGERMRALSDCCVGNVASWVDLLQGQMNDELMGILSSEESGIFPLPNEWLFSCNCADYADVCKHVAATLYAFGVMIDSEPELLFTLRNISANDLLPHQIDVASIDDDSRLRVDRNALQDMFGISLD